MRVSTPAATAFDLVRYPEHCGFLSNVATVLHDLAELLDGGDLVRVGELEGEVAYAQRLGYLLELVGRVEPARPLADWVASKAPRIVPLDPTQAMTGAPRNLRWRLAVNDEVEPDQGIA
jgi:predicted transcriptional regulator of viral defense system